MNSHLQTRTLTDALNLADDILKSRSTALAYSEQRNYLEASFAKECYPRFFNAWAFTGMDFDSAVERITQIAPRLAPRLEKPAHPNDFTIIGNCSMDLRFSPDPNGADPILLQLRNGDRVKGAQFTSSRTRVYSNHLIELPTEEAEFVYFYSPESEPLFSAANLAHLVFADRGEVIGTGVTLKFPVGQTSNLMDCSWVEELVSICGLYFVKNYISAGNALVDHNGFFAQETQVVQIKYRSISKQLTEIVIDKPFLVFFADIHGVHAAAWFSWDSFSVAEAL